MEWKNIYTFKMNEPTKFLFSGLFVSRVDIGAIREAKTKIGVEEGGADSRHSWNVAASSSPHFMDHLLKPTISSPKKLNSEFPPKSNYQHTCLAPSPVGKTSSFHPQKKEFNSFGFFHLILINISNTFKPIRT